MTVKTLVTLKIHLNRDGRLAAVASITVDGPTGFRYQRERTVETTLEEIVTWVGTLLA